MGSQQAAFRTRQILEEHCINVWPKLDAGTADRDCFLTSQDIRNIHSKLAVLTWKLHQNEAQSVRLFAQQHASNIFIYQEERSSQPSQPTQPLPAHQPSQPAVLAQPSPTDHSLQRELSEQPADVLQRPSFIELSQHTADAAQQPSRVELSRQPADALQQPVHRDYSAQPADPQQQPQQVCEQPDQQPQKFVMGMTPDSLLANLLKYGHTAAGCYIWHKPHEDAFVHWACHG